jgi:Predicted transcriptional regulator
MSAIKSIKTIQDYGGITLSLDKMLLTKNISRNKLAKLIDARFEVVDRFYTGKLVRLDLEILAKICYVLDCNVSDLMSYCSPE